MAVAVAAAAVAALSLSSCSGGGEGDAESGDTLKVWWGRTTTRRYTVGGIPILKAGNNWASDERA